MRQLFEIADGDTSERVSGKAAASLVGFSDTEMSQAVNDLKLMDLVEILDSIRDDFDPIISLTAKGRKELEAAASQRERPTDHFPAYRDMLFAACGVADYAPPTAAEDGVPAEEVLKKREADSCRHGYTCEDRLHVVGRVSTRQPNVVVLNDAPAEIADSLLILLLRLVSEFKQSKGGWVNRRSLANEGIVPQGEVWQPYFNLRSALKPYLVSAPLEYIENNKEKDYRISTHPDFVTYDRQRLLEHPSRRVREIAKKLP